jgi:alkylmercury lyase-like protein
MTTPTDLDWRVRTNIYQSFAATGKAPTLPELAETFQSTREHMAGSLERLHEAHQISPLPDGTGVWWANPFSAVETAYSVETPTMSTYAPCCWDALGIPAMLRTDGWIRTKCAGSETPLEFGIRDGELAGDDGVIHMVVPIGNAWDDIGFT